jgi:uncharacterized protein YebE (UPF0316 family)
MKNLDNWICYVAYASGFACGTWIGMNLKEKLSLPKVFRPGDWDDDYETWNH